MVFLKPGAIIEYSRSTFACPMPSNKPKQTNNAKRSHKEKDTTAARFTNSLGSLDNLKTKWKPTDTSPIKKKLKEKERHKQRTLAETLDLLRKKPALSPEGSSKKARKPDPNNRFSAPEEEKEDEEGEGSQLLPPKCTHITADWEVQGATG